MEWPWVSRARYEALEDRKDLEIKLLTKENAELREKADKLLDRMLDEKVAQAKEQVPEEPQRPRRPLGRDIVAQASMAAETRYQASRRGTA